MRGRLEAAIAASDRGTTRNGNLHQEKVVEPVGIDLDLGTVFQAVDRGIALAQVIHARLQIRAAAVQAQEMRLENPRHAGPHGVEIA